MNESQTKTINKLSHYAATLVSYAKTNEEFAGVLYAHTKQFLTEPYDIIDTYSSKYLRPGSFQIAENRLQWLEREITLHESRQTKEAKAVLATWAKDYESPEDLVLGIVGLAIIGPTLGLIKKKKKRKSQMKVVINASEFNKDQLHVLALALSASTGLLGNELATVGGHAYRLDPELADWLFAEHDTLTSEATADQLRQLISTLQSESLPHFILKTEGIIQAIAIAPSVSDRFLIDKL